MNNGNQKSGYSHRLNRYGLAAGVGLSLALAMTGCSSSSSDGVEGSGGNDGGGGSDGGSGSEVSTFDASEMLANTADNTVAGIYDRMATEAQEMEDAVTAFTDQPNADNLETARAEWVDTRVFWERSESFLFGPVDSDGIDPRIDEWPLDESQLDQVLADNAGNVDQTLIDSLPNNLRGFHVVEFLLWSDSNNSNDEDDPAEGQDSLNNVVSAIANNADRAEYLKQAAIDVRQQADTLRDAWAPDDDENFGSRLETAGVEGNTTFASQSAGVQQVIDGMIVIADEVGAGKISDPFNEEDPLIVESKHSFNSRTDFKNNIRGIKHIYLGDFPFQSDGGEDGAGVTDFVQAVGTSATDQAVRNQIDLAIDQIDQIEQPFRDSITKDDTQRAQIQNAIDAVLEIRRLLEEEVTPLLDDAEFAQ